MHLHDFYEICDMIFFLNVKNNIVKLTIPIHLEAKLKNGYYH
jgi:hypothetical protein